MSAPQPQVPESGNTVVYTAGPWREFFDIRTLLLPHSFSEALARVDKNYLHFRYNYGVLGFMIILLLILLDVSFEHTVTKFLLVVGFFALIYRYISLRYVGSLFHVFGFTVDDGNITRTLFFVSVFAILFYHPSGHVHVFSLVYIVLIYCHCALKVPLVETEQDPYKSLLADNAAAGFSGGPTYNTMP